MFAKRAHVMERMDRWRGAAEPSGYPCSNVDYLVEPTLAGADAGFVIAEQAKIYPLMSGHNTICAPGGLPIAADVAADGRCERVTFGGTPSFVGKRGGRRDFAPPVRAGAPGDRENASEVAPRDDRSSRIS
ncbi:trans-L-3-hydroxyproline dehydratase [Aureococcus anophagefferens]|nr:trans-L-3-hydroxyproline dehydratase [Aureococcus anophagefferens]